MFSSQDLLNGVRMTQLNDPDATTWPDSTLIIALNQALRMLTLIRPDATAKIAVIPLDKNSRQFIPSDGVRLLRVVRNITASGGIGRTVRLISQESMDSMTPSWHTISGPIVKEYMFDSRSPKHFYVYPVPLTGAGRNLLDLSKVVRGSFVDADGILQTNGVPTAIAVSDYIPVVAGEKYTISSTGLSTDAFANTSYFDADKKFINRISTPDRNTPGLTITIPAGVAFLRFNLDQGPPEAKSRMFNKGPVALPYDLGIPGTKLEIEYSSYPTDVTEANAAALLPVSPVFAQPLQELMLYKLLSGDASNGGAGIRHLKTAMTLLDAKDSADKNSSAARRTSI